MTIELDSLLKFYPENLSGFKRNILTEYLQCKILSIINTSVSYDKLAFIGGTAIRLCYDNPRFSEDLDFDNLKLSKKEFEQLAQKIFLQLKNEGYNIKYDLSFKNAFRCFLRFPSLYYHYNLSSHPEEKLLIQIDAEPQNMKYKQEIKIINKFGMFIRINVPLVSVLLSMKICAILKRKREKGRDFIDFVFLSSFTKPDFNYLKEKTGISSAGELKEKLYEKVKNINLKTLANDVAPFLFNSEDKNKILYFKEFLKEWKI